MGGVHVRQYVCRRVVVEQSVYVCEGNVCVGTSVCGGDDNIGVVVYVYFCCHEVWGGPCGDKLVCYVAFDHNGYAFMVALCVACCVSVVFDCACGGEVPGVVEKYNVRIFGDYGIRYEMAVTVVTATV